MNSILYNINFKNLQLHSTGTPETLIKINNDKNVLMTELLNFLEIEKQSKMTQQSTLNRTLNL